MTTSAVPIVVLASTDRTDRDALVMTALLDAPGVVAVVHDLESDGDGGTDGDPDVVLRRRVLGEGGLEGSLGFRSGDAGPASPSRDEVVPMEHACPGCALREDAVPVIAELLEAAADGSTPCAACCSPSRSARRSSRPHAPSSRPPDRRVPCTAHGSASPSRWSTAHAHSPSCTTATTRCSRS
ncbi:hypothetical protein [Litorihabitans aurantiacus]|nr:hypothetical protein [Litorihabitans aurantiacus]